MKREQNPDVMMSLPFAIGHHDRSLSKLHIKQLCAFAETNNNLVKQGLVFALNGKDTTDAIHVLIRLSKDMSAHIGDWSAFGLGTQIKRDTKMIRADRVDDKHQKTKLEATAGLAKRNDSKILAIIQKELLNGEYSIVLFEAILELADRALLPVLRPHYKNEKKS